ncbi:Rpn family recombination-promoting nuclease/putative transposase [Oscillatoriales cyanobacterium LEGE 11467]|uniref:Rpn family recombination-promoting nuclease/putative transposase n=1 Tax=Zarconia navalis LEGE 11467 TaxID=1828826 RepID=A0A928Z977_9CYAN|nr:Rpn family recombination-promoting nuclease/putative transposase [Zarconia navalis]MBE9041394.1 Rpn family recombination-promoting nuclease/putative transposase [Zarconia navalis LEGE 11467]
MRFINPKIDFGFKKIFGSQDSQEILISFLNAILYDGEPTIEFLTILNPHLAPRIRGFKDTYLDVKAQLNSGKTVVIEMQVLNIEGFEKRILYNAAKTYSMQLKQGEDYTELNPVIALTITDFVMFPDWEKFTSWFVLKEKDFLMDYPIYDLELVFVELPKFEKNLEEVRTLCDKWLYFIQRARQMNEIPPILGKVTAISEAFSIANIANLSEEELSDLEHREIFIHDQRNAFVRAERSGWKRGLEQGLEQGQQESKVEIARQLLGILDEATVAQMTGLTIEKIREIDRP